MYLESVNIKNLRKENVQQILFNSNGDLLVASFNKEKKTFLVQCITKDHIKGKTFISQHIPQVIGNNRLYFLIYDDDLDQYNLVIKLRKWIIV